MLRFRRLAGYSQLIYLIYGDDTPSRLIKRLEIAARGIEEIDQIEVWHHAFPGEAAVRIT